MFLIFSHIASPSAFPPLAFRWMLSLYKEWAFSSWELKLTELSKKTNELASQNSFKDWFVCSITLFASLSFFRGRMEDIIM